MYSLWVTQYQDLVNINDSFSFHQFGVFHTLYIVKLSDKYENVLKKICWNYAYLILGLEYQYVGNWHNNATCISSVAMNIGMVNMHKCLPWSCHMLLHIHDAHTASQSFYMSQIKNYQFHQNFCFLNVDLDHRASSNNNNTMKVMMNEYFLQICTTHKHT